ncbi:MAG: ABC transporter substrate-binding protein [Kangiellaceae bacterium]|jgi:dipeptide transport system substrate-binding protein|nr:ABC transporter substrate-binding protein [Kangiellaceae bacterium]
MKTNVQKINHIRQLFIATMVGLLLACGDGHNQHSVVNDTLVYCSEGSPNSFDPHTVTLGTAHDASARQIYNRLVSFKPGTVDITPSLAVRWRVNSRGDEYTFYLRKNVAFHSSELFTPTRFFNADDVLFSFNRQRMSDHPYHTVGGKAYTYFRTQGLQQLINDIIKIDQHTIKFKLNQPSSPFLSMLAMEFTSIMSAEYAAQLNASDNKELIINKPIGTGPFKFVRYQPDAYIRYQAHDGYWKGEETIKHLVFAITPDPSLRFARLTANECDVMSNPLPIHLRATPKGGDLEVLSEQQLNIAYWAFNTRKPPFDSSLVRRALNHAINKQAIINAVYFESAVVAINPLPPQMWSYNKTIADYDYNPQLAKNLLYRAGYPDGFEIEISVFPEQRSYNPNAVKTAELIQEDLKAINVKATIQTYEVGSYFRRVRSGQHHSAIQGWIADNGDPDNFFGPLLSCAATIPGQNIAFWCNKDFDAIITDARKISSKKLRTELYQQAQKIFKQEAPWLTLAHSKQSLIVNKRVENLIISPSGGIFFSGVSLADLSHNNTSETDAALKVGTKNSSEASRKENNNAPEESL